MNMNLTDYDNTNDILRNKCSKISRHSENHMGKESKQKHVRYGAEEFKVCSLRRDIHSICPKLGC